MAEVNPEADPHLAGPSKDQHASYDESLLNQIQHLKKVILNLQRRHQAKPKISHKIIEGKSQVDEQELKRPPTCNEEGHSKLAFGNDFKKSINQSFRTRAIGKNHKIENDQLSSAENQIAEEQSEERSIIYQLKKDSHLSETQKTDQEQQEPPKTQWVSSRLPHGKEQINQHHFRKKDYIPAIEADSNKFHRYLNTYRQRNSALKQKRQDRQISSLATSRQQFYNSSSQPQFPRKSFLRHQPSLQNFLNIIIGPSSSKEEVVEAGQKIFRHFMSSSQANNFTIKKYKNCIVFSLMPNYTKAAIWYYSQELYFGNISINEDGKMQRNGSGVQWVNKRHYYQGHFIKNKKNGRGKISYDNGDSYDGQWYDGHIYGFGRYIDHNDVTYQGFWRNGQYEGQIGKNKNSLFDFP